VPDGLDGFQVMMSMNDIGRAGQVAQRRNSRYSGSQQRSRYDGIQSGRPDHWKMAQPLQAGCQIHRHDFCAGPVDDSDICDEDAERTVHVCLESNEIATTT
jgi:hypothetical protein